MMKKIALDVRTVLLLLDPSKTKILILKRSNTKKLFPELMTGIGGKVEEGEYTDILGSMMREFQEETCINPQDLESINLRLITLDQRGDSTHLLYWTTGVLKNLPDDLSCNEGELEWLDIQRLLKGEFDQYGKGFIASAEVCIKYILQLDTHDQLIHTAVMHMNEGKLKLSAGAA
ncbi:MAG: NUDIX hydrolase [Candidatus Gracilibacteria bacterium]